MIEDIFKSLAAGVPAFSGLTFPKSATKASPITETGL